MPEENKTYAVIYCRISTKEVAHKISPANTLPNQLRTCLDECNALGFDVVAAFCDIGSAEELENNPTSGMNQAIEMAKALPAKLVCAYVNRLLRSIHSPNYSLYRDGILHFPNGTLNGMDKTGET